MVISNNAANLKGAANSLLDLSKVPFLWCKPIIYLKVPWRKQVCSSRYKSLPPNPGANIRCLVGIDFVRKCCCRVPLERTAVAYKVEAGVPLTPHIVITQHGVCLSAALHPGDTEVNSPISPKTAQYWLLSFKSTKKSHLRDWSCHNRLIGCLWCFPFRPSLPVVLGGWRWRGNVMQRSDWSETECQEKTQVHTRVAYTVALLPVHTHMHTNERTGTWVYTPTDMHTSMHIQGCVVQYKEKHTSTHIQSGLWVVHLNTSRSISHLWKGKLNFTGTKLTPLRSLEKKPH